MIKTLLKFEQSNLKPFFASLIVLFSSLLIVIETFINLRPYGSISSLFSTFDGLKCVSIIYVYLIFVSSLITFILLFVRKCPPILLYVDAVLLAIMPFFWCLNEAVYNSSLPEDGLTYQETYFRTYSFLLILFDIILVVAVSFGSLLAINLLKENDSFSKERTYRLLAILPLILVTLPCLISFSFFIPPFNLGYVVSFEHIVFPIGILVIYIFFFLYHFFLKSKRLSKILKIILPLIVIVAFIGLMIVICLVVLFIGIGLVNNSTDSTTATSVGEAVGEVVGNTIGSLALIIVGIVIVLIVIFHSTFPLVFIGAIFAYDAFGYKKKDDREKIASNLIET